MVIWGKHTANCCGCLGSSCNPSVPATLCCWNNASGICFGRTRNHDAVITKNSSAFGSITATSSRSKQCNCVISVTVQLNISDGCSSEANATLAIFSPKRFQIYILKRLHSFCAWLKTYLKQIFWFWLARCLPDEKANDLMIPLPGP